MRAPDFLAQGQKDMQARAALRDTPEGERSMQKTVAAFNAIFGTTLTETQGWQFMAILKVVRGSQGQFHPDDFVDQASYAALAGESASRANLTANMVDYTKADIAHMARHRGDTVLDRDEIEQIIAPRTKT